MLMRGAPFGHFLHLLPHLGSRIGEVDAVAEALAHFLLAVGSGQTACRNVFGSMISGSTSTSL